MLENFLVFWTNAAFKNIEFVFKILFIKTLFLNLLNMDLQNIKFLKVLGFDNLYILCWPKKEARFGY